MTRKTFKIFILTFIAAITLASCGSKQDGFYAFAKKRHIIWENDEISISLESFDDTDKLAPVITLGFENKTGEERYCQTAGVYVNDLRIYSSLNVVLDPHGSTTERLKADTHLLEPAIPEIGTVDIDFYYGLNELDENLNSDINHTGYIRLYTKAKKKQSPPEGDVIYEENDVKIVSLYNSYPEELKGFLPMYVENHSDKRVTVTIRDIRLNGEEIPYYTSVGDIHAGKNEMRIRRYENIIPDDVAEIKSLEIKFAMNFDSGDIASFERIETDYIPIPIKN